VETPFRIMTYNVHRCVGTVRKLSPQRIAEVIAPCDPDIVALQEIDVVRMHTGGIDVRIIRTRPARLASDQLPLVAEFRIRPADVARVERA
jgi:endonuclease/exonuclease/phosphatase family metal-dependent hydrolase